MFTFLLDEYKEKALKEYHLRLWSLYLSLFALALLVGCVLAIPQYAMLGSKRDAALLEKNAAGAAPQGESASIKAEVKEIKSKLSMIRENSGKEPIMTVLARVLETRESGIEITSISLSRGGNPSAIMIGGIAATRDALVSFSKRLQEVPSFSNAVLPVSALAKSKDIAFSISIDSKF